jgi:biotin carboxylase
MCGKPRLLILGGNRYNLQCIQAATDAGFVTFVADRNPAAPGLAVACKGLPIDFFDCERLLPVLAANGGIDGVVSMAEAGVRVAAEISRRLGLPSIGVAAAENVTSKVAMRRAWSQLKNYSVNFGVATTRFEAHEICQRLAYPLIFKPDRSFGGARGVSRVDAVDEIDAAFAFAQSGSLEGADVIIERCVTGTEHSAEVLIWAGRVSILCIGQKVKSKRPYRVDVSVQYPAPLSAAQEALIAEMCQQAIGALGITRGAAHIEFALTVDGPVLFELGARCGGGHTPQIAHYVSGVNEFVESCRMACGLAPEEIFPKQKNGADYRFLIFPPGKLAEVKIPEKLKTHPDVLDVDVTFQPGQYVRPLQTTADRAGFLIATKSDRQSAVDLADSACRQVCVKYEDGGVGHAYTLADFEG